ARWWTCCSPRGDDVTEAQWLACTDPASMLYALRGRASERKLRLFVAAWCRQFWPALEDERSRAVVIALERRADGRISAADLDRAASAACAAAVALKITGGFRASYAATLAWQAASVREVIAAADWSDRCPASVRLGDTEQGPRVLRQSDVLRDVFGNPFQP